MGQPAGTCVSGQHRDDDRPQQLQSRLDQDSLIHRLLGLQHQPQSQRDRQRREQRGRGGQTDRIAGVALGQESQDIRGHRARNAAYHDHADQVLAAQPADASHQIGQQRHRDILEGRASQNRRPTLQQLPDFVPRQHPADRKHRDGDQQPQPRSRLQEWVRTDGHPMRPAVGCQGRQKKPYKQESLEHRRGSNGNTFLVALEHQLIRLFNRRPPLLC